MKKLEDKRVLITGGTSGIGLATAKLFQEEGARLIITGRSADGLAKAQEELGPDALVVRSEAGNLLEIEALMEQVKNAFGNLDVLFLNAAISKIAHARDISETDFDSIMSVNVKGVFFTIQKALQLFSRSASVIVTTSIANRTASPNSSVYAASKAALRSFVQTLGLELIGSGIRVNAVSPGPIATPMFNHIGLSQEAALAIKRELMEKSPIKRLGLPDEVAKAVLFLASDDSSYIVGEEIVVDGGISLDRSVKHDLNRTM